MASLRSKPSGCTACDACEPVCPNEAIKVGEPIYIIDAFRCTECVGAEDEPQCVLVCPEACILPMDRPSEGDYYRELHRRMGGG